jgi:predicted acylesterase/phospholipase RssA
MGLAPEPVDERIRLQIVFQGGGAKLCALMAVCAVLEEKEFADQILIGQVAGTSAGAIVAAMVASETSIKDYKARLKEVAARHLLGLENYKTFGYRRVLWGQPYHQKLVLQQFFRDLFCPGKELFIRDLRQRIKTNIYYTDLFSLTARNVEDSEAVPTALEKSCRIPIAFSGFKSDNQHVDGGLALNLPVDELLAEESTAGTLIGISFASSFPDPFNGGIIEYTKHLFSAAIQANVNRSVLLMDKRNVFPIETNIGTFDFERALGEGLGDKFDDVKDQFRDWLRVWLASAKPLLARSPDGPTRFVRPILNPAPLPQSIVDELNDRFRSEEFTYAELISGYDTAVVDQKGKFTGKYRSKVYNKLRIAKKTKILTYDFQAGQGTVNFSDMKFGFMVIDSVGTPLQFVGHVQELTQPKDKLKSFRLFLLFSEELTPGSPNQPYVLELQYEVDNPFPGLGKAGDALTLTRGHGNAREMIVAAAFPGDKVPVNHTVSDISSLSKEELAKIDYIVDSLDGIVPSEEMKQNELIDPLNLDLPPNNYVIVGRRLRNAKQGDCFGLAIR